MGQPSKEVKARYRERHREKIRAWNREYARRKRRAEGQAIRGSAEWLAKRGTDHYVRGERHGNWKGDDVGYFACHFWLKKNYPRKQVCSACKGKGRTEWAYLGSAGRYMRDIRMYVELCSSCHKRFDMTDERRANIGRASKRRATSEKMSEMGKLGARARWGN